MLKDKYNKLNNETASSILDKYFETKSLQRLKGKGLFCGMDYVGIDKLRPNEYYSRYDHSKNISYTAFKLSEDLKIALSGAVHDVGSMCFAHVNSFKKGDSLNQESDELSIKEVIMKDEQFLEYLYQDKINLNDIIYPSNYPLIDKKIPCLCLDRVDGILATCLFWAKTHSFEEIESLYNMLTYFENLNGVHFDIFNERLRNFNGEIVLSEYNDSTYEDFFKAITVYSKLLLTKEDRYLMEILGLTLKYYEDIGVIKEIDLFELSEEEIINKILNSKYKTVLKDVLSLDKVRYAKEEDEGLIIVSKPKIRQANPLCIGQMEVCEIDGISGNFYRELNNLKEDIKLTDRPITGDLSKETVKILSKYKI